MADFHRILGVSRDADTGEIRRAFRQLARQHHPDVSGEPDASRFQEIRRAYEALTAGRADRWSADGSVEVRVGRGAGSAFARATADGPDAWLSDEVAIDFPSVDAILDRIRASFFGAPPAPARLRAEIELTPDEASRGAVVPLDLPVHVACSMCAGAPSDLTVPGAECALCGGCGEVLERHPVQLSVPRGVRDGARVRLSVTPPHARPTIVEIRIAVR